MVEWRNTPHKRLASVTKEEMIDSVIKKACANTQSKAQQKLRTHPLWYIHLPTCCFFFPLTNSNVYCALKTALVLTFPSVWIDILEVYGLCYETYLLICRLGVMYLKSCVFWKPQFTYKNENLTGTRLCWLKEWFGAWFKISCCLQVQSCLSGSAILLKFFVKWLSLDIAGPWLR